MAPTFASIDPPADPDYAGYFSVEELREAEPDVSGYTDEQLTEMRDLVEEVIENGAGVAFIPRRHTERLQGGPAVKLSRRLVREIEEVDVNGDVWGEDEVLERLHTDGSWLWGSVWGHATHITYTHGYDAPPARIRRAAMILARVWLVRGPIDDRATQIAGDGASVNLSTPGMFGSITGVPEVDAAIKAYAQQGYLV